MGRGKAHVWRIGDGTVIAGIDMSKAFDTFPRARLLDLI